jgi:TolA-binding protein
MIPTRSRKATVAVLSAGIMQCAVSAQSEPVPRARPAVPATSVTPDEKVLRNDREESLIKYAHYIYSQKQWQLAEAQYDKYLKLYPEGKEAAPAGYRMAECRLKQDNIKKAEQAYLNVLHQFRDSDYAAPSAYRHSAERIQKERDSSLRGLLPGKFLQETGPD